MYQSKEKIQTVVLLLADLICFVISYFGGGYLWLVLYRNVSVQNMKSELMDSFGIVLVIYMLILLFSDLEKNFIRRNLARDFWAALEASVIMIFVTALTIFLQHNNADASRGVYFCIAGMNLVLFFVAHAAIKYYLLHIYRNKRGTNQLFLVTTTDRVKDTLAEIENAKDWEHRLTGIAIIDDNQIGTWYEGIPVVATYDTMFQYAKEQIVDEVFLNVPYDTGESLAKVVEMFEDMGATVHITIELLKRFDDYHKNFNMMGNVPVVTFSNQYYDWKMLFVKRLMDIAGAIVGLAIGGGFYEGGIAVSVLVLLAELVFSRLEYRILDNVPEINLYMEYSDKDCLENVLQLLRQNRLSISNMEITRSAGSEEHNACAIFALHLKKGCRTEELIQKIQRIEGVVSVEEI